METTGKIPLSLYFHIPFCKKKCPYCHFYVIGDNESKKDLLLKTFYKEFKLLEIPEKFQIVSIYLGGGTPSLFGPARIKNLISFIKDSYPFIDPACEITLEANPCDVTFENMLGFKNAGINRVSLGVQSLHDASLITIGRQHSKNKALDAIKDIQKSGISNISIDLMYDRPNQTLEDWKEELKLLKNLNITHLSLYNMTIEEGSAYKRREKKIKSQMPNEDLSFELHKSALSAIEEAGLTRYEISAFAKPGFESRHNLGYWQQRSFYGLGPSAFSYINSTRKKNVSSLASYVEAIDNGMLAYDFEETLDEEARRRELFLVAIRVLSGVDLKGFEIKNGCLSEEMKKDIAHLIEKGFILMQNETYRLTEKGQLFYDEVGAILV